MPRLQSLIERALLTALTTENVCHILNTTKVYNYPFLQSKCIQFIVLHLDVVRRHSDFRTLDKDFLLAIILGQ
jgi:hypothetical protein